MGGGNGSNELDRRVNPTRVPIPQKETLPWADKLNDAAALLGESGCGEHIGGRDAGLDELFGAAIEVAEHFVI